MPLLPFASAPSSGGGGPPSGAAGGDLSGNYPNPTVSGIQNVKISATLPANNDVLTYNNITGIWEPTPAQGGSPTGTAGGDLSGTYPNPTVSGIQNVKVSAETPVNNQVLIFNGSTNRWEPQILPLAGNLTYYLQDTAEGVISGYKKMLTAPYSPKTTESYTPADGTHVLQNYITNVGFPNLSFIPAGQYGVHIHASKAAGQFTIYAEIWETDSAGNDIAKIGTTDQQVTTNAELEYTLVFSNGNVYDMASSSSRLDCRVYAITTSSPTCRIYVGGEADSKVFLPSNTVDATNFVPYKGATDNVDLDLKSLNTSKVTTQGLAVSGLTTISGNTTHSGNVTLQNNGTADLNTNQYPSYDLKLLASAWMLGSDGTGGTITHSGGKTIHTFTSDGTFTPPNGISSVEVVVVAGGGGGGSGDGGGGGAGGLVYNANYSVTGGSPISVTVGAGAVAVKSVPNVEGNNGDNSVFGSIMATGGGGGGCITGGQQAGRAGGSGGGGGGDVSGAGGAGTAGQGNDGGAGVNIGAGGGGGAGAVGQDGSSTHGGDGGVGIANPIAGSTAGQNVGGTYYLAGGGGGGIYNYGTGQTVGAGGSGGGGAGGLSNANGVDGTANTGGGGGGARNGDGVGNVYGGAGGSGIVIVTYIPASSSEMKKTLKLRNVATGNLTTPLQKLVLYDENDAEITSVDDTGSIHLKAGAKVYQNGINTIQQVLSITNNIDLKTTGTTDLYTADVDTLVTAVIVRVTLATSFTVEPTGVNFGTNATAYDNILADAYITGLLNVNDMNVQQNSGVYPVVTAGQVVKMKITGGATATAAEAQVLVLGYRI